MRIDHLTAQKDYLKVVEVRLDAVLAGGVSPDAWHHLHIIKDELKFARERITEHPFLETFIKLVGLEGATSRLIQEWEVNDLALL